jgi:hypothetical protein
MASGGKLITSPGSMAAACEIEGVDLDFHLLTGMDGSNIAVGYRGLDFELGLTRYHHRECLGRRHPASDRMDGELLNDAVDRCGQAEAWFAARP